jgi:parallel beta-helix repeat protein
MLSDLGGIYSLGISPGTILRNNLIHDSYSYGYGGWGIYTDEGSTDILIENNIVYNTKTGGFHQHYGKENIIRNNIFAFTKEQQLQRTRQEPHISFFFDHNIIYFDEGVLLGSNWNDDKYKMDYNIYWDASGRPIDFAKASFDDWKRRGHDANSLIADPKFVNPKKHDFDLKGDSPAFKLGFKPIDVKHVGPRTNVGPEK